MKPADWPMVRGILEDALQSGEASFEVDPPSWEEFDAARLPELRLVAEHDGAVVGWAAGARASPRPVLHGVIDHAVYVAREARGRGVGRTLLGDFVTRAESQGVWTIQSQVFPENVASLALHRSFGFRVVGYRERLAQCRRGPYAGQWRDALLIERRSARNGLR